MAGSRCQSSKKVYVDHYAVLGLPSGEKGSKLSLKEIRKAYLNQSRIRHPDKRLDDPNATTDFQLLTSSFEFLLDKVKRSDFDAKLRARREQVRPDSFQDAKRRKMATDLEERERSAAVAVNPTEEKSKAELKKELTEIRARRAKKASESVRAAQSMSVPLEPIAPMFSDTTSTNQNESMGPGINNFVGAGFQDYEAYVMKKLQEANERKKCMR